MTSAEKPVSVSNACLAFLSHSSIKCTKHILFLKIQFSKCLFLLWFQYKQGIGQHCQVNGFTIGEIYIVLIYNYCKPGEFPHQKLGDSVNCCVFVVPISHKNTASTFEAKINCQYLAVSISTQPSTPLKYLTDNFLVHCTPHTAS